MPLSSSNQQPLCRRPLIIFSNCFQSLLPCAKVTSKKVQQMSLSFVHYFSWLSFSLPNLEHSKHQAATDGTDNLTQWPAANELIILFYTTSQRRRRDIDFLVYTTEAPLGSDRIGSFQARARGTIVGFCQLLCLYPGMALCSKYGRSIDGIYWNSLYVEPSFVEDARIKSVLFNVNVYIVSLCLSCFAPGWWRKRGAYRYIRLCCWHCVDRFAISIN